MPLKPVLAISHKVALSVGGIVRYRIKLLPSHAKNIDKVHFHIRNCAPIYRNITPSSGPWKIAIALVRNPDKLPVVPELVPSLGCAQVSRLDASVNHETSEPDENEWELEVLSEMILQNNWIDIKVEVFVVPLTDITSLGPITTDNVQNEGADTEVQPHVYLPDILSCDYKDTRAICGPARPEEVLRTGDEDGLHLVLLTHGIHGTWLDMLYIKEQIDTYNKNNGKTITYLTDTNHAGTEEGIQMAGQRVALDILDWTGYFDTVQGKQLRKTLNSSTSNISKSKSEVAAAKESQSQSLTKPFPRGISKVSIIGHSLGGLINMYALGFIEEVTQGDFFKAIQPVHFVTIASPLLGVGFEHPWVLGYALSLGVIGQTGKDLALENRSSRLKRSASSASSVATLSSTSTSSTKSSTSVPGLVLECSLDKDPEPLLLAMARAGSTSHQVLKKFISRTSYANIENDMAVKFNTSSMMGIPSFDMDQFFSPEGAATQPKKGIYHSAAVSILALLLPQTPPRAKFLSIADAPSPVVVIEHVEAGSIEKTDGTFESKTTSMATLDDNNTIKKIDSVKSAGTSNRSGSRLSARSKSSSKASSQSGSISTQTDVSTMSRLDLARLVSEGYHTDMDWTKIGVFIEHEAHVQIIVRRKWYNLEGWKCVQDLAERFDFA
ncbi:hypothetical protein FBU30_004140 [Linnemannia zychae]|nr:hypothetical protein FBU30_004140 [Linnemannia zychae]